MRPEGNVFLVGPMGAGKTTVGRLLARKLGLRFLDIDHEVEARTGVSIRTIFDLEGEAGFRRRESAILDELSREQGLLLSTGGGVVLAAENRRCMKERGTVIYLRAELDDLVRRTRRDKSRPLLQCDDPRAALRKVLEERDPLYREVADYVVGTGERKPRSVVKDILALLPA